MTLQPFNRDTPLAELRARTEAARSAAFPLEQTPSRLSRIIGRHRKAQERNYEVSAVVVTQDGRIATLEETGREVTVSRVTTQIFAAVPWDEAALVRQHLPNSAFASGGGWVYSVTNDFADTFELFLYHDDFARIYRVRLITPDISALGESHRHHLYGDGHLCLSKNPGSGQGLLNNAYGESVLWCAGIGAVMRGHAWPWGE